MEKVKQIVADRLPGFAGRYFNYNMNIKTPRSLYGYALDLTIFFDYLESINYVAKSMTLQDLESITPQIIEDYIEYSRYYIRNGVKTETSACGLARRYSSLSSFFNYYYRLDLIDSNPVHKVNRPRPTQNKLHIPSNVINLEVLDFIANGKLGGKKDSYRQKTKERDLAIIILIIGAGLKVSDVVDLNIEDVNLESNYLIVHSRYTTRKVFFSDVISHAISQYLGKRLSIIAESGDDNALFLGIYGKRIGIRAVEIMIRKYSSAMFGEKDHLTGEALKLSFRNNVFDQTMNINLTSAATGNGRETVLRRYRPYIEQYEYHKGKEFAFRGNDQQESDL